MLNTKEILKEIDFLASTNISVKEFYSDLHKAIESNNKDSVWQLSKIITRYQIQTQTRQQFNDSQ